MPSQHFLDAKQTLIYASYETKEEWLMLKEKFDVFPLTVEELSKLVCFDYKMKVVLTHPGWTDEGLEELLNLNWYAKEIFSSLDKLDLLKKFVDIQKSKGFYVPKDIMGKGKHLSVETLDWATRNGFYPLVANPMTPEDAVNFWLSTLDLENQTSWLEACRTAHELLKRPHLTSNHIGWIGSVIELDRVRRNSRDQNWNVSPSEALFYFFRNIKLPILAALAENPSTPLNTLTSIESLSRQSAIRMKIIENPNVSKGLLKKLATSTDLTVRTAANTRLASC